MSAAPRTTWRPARRTAIGAAILGSAGALIPAALAPAHGSTTSSDRATTASTSAKRSGTTIMEKPPTEKGAAEWFTGDVYIDHIVTGEEPSRLRAASVHFTPGARTAWHRHAVGQTLHVTEGVGLVQGRGGKVQVIHPGETVRIPAGEWHWHGATPEDFMTHLAMWEGIGTSDGSETEWGDHVTDAEYNSRK
ncbi:(R)-mandelonitrile lyase [Streptomyces flaveus]|uniref:(R)-mandelonitrile lyase n=1 Tax=Streptomyces flaveus TaxID=66370 RepID=UPI00332C25DE